MKGDPLTLEQEETLYFFGLGDKAIVIDSNHPFLTEEERARVYKILTHWLQEVETCFDCTEQELCAIHNMSRDDVKTGLAADPCIEAYDTTDWNVTLQDGLENDPWIDED